MSDHHSHADLVELVPRLAGKRILVYGDLVADEFVFTGASRVSREAPVLILQHRSSKIVPGGAANAAANIAALGGTPVLLGEIADDEPGRRLLELLEKAGAEVGEVMVHPDGATPVKTRILAGDRNVARQQVVRVDRIESRPRGEDFLRDLKARALKLLPTVDGVLVSDYGIGFVDPESVNALVLQSPARAGLRVALDSRYRLFDYPGVDVATPSEPELEEALERSLGSEAERERAARDTLERLRSEALVLTRGSLGMEVIERDAETAVIAPFGDDDVTDVTGAGDTVIATLCLALSAGASFTDAARLANAAAGLVVAKLGTATVSTAELTAALQSG